MGVFEKVAEKPKFFTVVFIPNSSGKVRKLVVPRVFISIGIVALVMCFFVLLYFASGYTIIKNRIAYFENLEELTQIQAEQIISLNERVVQFRNTLDRLKEMEEKLKTMIGAGTGGGIATGKSPGVGGHSQYIQTNLYVNNFPAQLVNAEPIQFIDGVHRDLKLLKDEATLRETNFTRIKQLIDEKEALFASTPNIYPAKGWISSSYGSRINPFTGRREMHTGVDIAAAWGTPVRAAARGEVVFAGWKDFYGLVVEIKNRYDYRTLYAHMSKTTVKKGERVEKGQIVGNVGSTGRSTGPHLHFEVWRSGKSLNPLTLMVEPLN